ncbi:class I SAM-dependent methyltransferase [Gordonia sp. zg691]|uniref:class I SAM-dependent methyltransferase n=1 Tax=Gordonia jinghuaiqii TaxID=2758710 RepID=UPI001662288C|nr:class I SAM-dependent methyltransferase [Gordonia jinghuaiqii]MBD0861655.1 class I SAM-dependent methyltransferase [Gordonia jinghuaiqii]
MTQAHRHTTHQHGTHAHGDHAHLASVLDLDAELLGSHIDDAATLIESALGRTPAHIVDLGAGTGTGTEVLARRFPHARLTAVDSSPEMTALIEQRARTAGFSSRLATVVADLDDGLPQVASPDVAWAAMSLHHVADPMSLLREIAAAVGPDGVVAIVEMAGVPQFLSGVEDDALRALEDRCHSASATAGWEALVDWTDALDDAGYDVLRHETIQVERDGPSQAVAQYARHWFGQYRHRLADDLEPADLTLIDELVDPARPAALHRRDDLTLRAGRLIWIARPRPAETRPATTDSRNEAS